MSNIQVGSTVKVISGGRYLGKEGKVAAMIPHGPVGFFKVLIDGSFPRSKNPNRQEFMISDLKLIQTPLQTAKAELAEMKEQVNEEFMAIPAPLRNIEKKLNLGGQHTNSTPLPTNEDDAELARLCEPLVIPTPIYNGLAGRLAGRFGPSTDTASHLIVKALAGCGKSTSMLQGVREMRNDWRCLCGGKAGFINGIPKCKVCRNGTGIVQRLTPTSQQAAIWKEMSLSRDAKSVCMVAFNKAIAGELKMKVPPGVEASTMHSLGLKSVTRAYGRVSVNEYRVANIICELAGRYPGDIRRSQDDLFRTNRVLLKATEELVSLCKMNMVELNSLPDESLTQNEMEAARAENHGIIGSIASYYEVDLQGGNAAEVFDLVPRVLERCLDVRKDMSIDYNDMVWLPAIQDLPMVMHDVLIVDESQDLNKCQQTLVRKSGRRIIMVGDKNQAIYAWAGADAASMDRMEQELSATERGCTVLPLTQTRRCGKAIVRECQKLVPEFEAFETNPEGMIREMRYPSKLLPVEASFMAVIKDGDMVLCRCNAPLVNTCFRFLKMGRKASIQGRNIGQGLISTIKKQMKDEQSVSVLSSRMDDWRNSEIAKETARQNPSENKLININDRYDCILMFMQDQRTVQDVIRRIEGVFTDNKDNPGIKLSSIHKAKGTEADNVYLLQLKGASCPHPMAKSAWAREGERCCLYVAQSRAIYTLTYVYDEGEEGDE